MLIGTHEKFKCFEDDWKGLSGFKKIKGFDFF